MATDETQKFRLRSIPGTPFNVAIPVDMEDGDEALERALEVLRAEGGNADNRIFDTGPNNHVSGTGQDLSRAIEVLRTEGTDAASSAND